MLGFLITANTNKIKKKVGILTKTSMLREINKSTGKATCCAKNGIFFNGMASRFAKPIMAPKMSRLNNNWLKKLAKPAESESAKMYDRTPKA